MTQAHSRHFNRDRPVNQALFLQQVIGAANWSVVGRLEGWLFMAQAEGSVQSKEKPVFGALPM